MGKRKHVLSATTGEPSNRKRVSAVTTGEPSHAAPMVQRVLIAHDGRIFGFKTDADCKGVDGSIFLAHVPKVTDPSLIWQCNCDNPTTADHLWLRDHDPATSANPCWTALELVRIVNGAIQNFEDSAFQAIYEESTVKKAIRSTKEVKFDVDTFGEVTRTEFIYRGMADNWLCRVCKYEGFPSNVMVEYAPRPRDFFDIWKRYGFPLMAGSTTKLNIGKRTKRKKGKIDQTKFYDGAYGKVPVIVKRVVMENAPSSYFLSTIYHWLSNGHHGLVRVFDTGFDSDKYFHVAMDKCTSTLEELVSKPFTFSNSGRVKTILREVFQGMKYLHEENVVHGSIRPSNIFKKVYKDGTSLTKLGGMGRCKLMQKGIRECAKKGDLGDYGRDYFSYGRTILNVVSKGGHYFDDDDQLDDFNFEVGEMFDDDMDALNKVDPIAHDLVSKLLQWKKYCSTVTDILNHSFFWPPGKYLAFLMRVSDRISDHNPNKKLLKAIDAKSKDVFDPDWVSKIDTDWYTRMTKPPPTPQNQNPQNPPPPNPNPKKARNKKQKYNKKKISGLLRIIRNTVHHPDNLIDPNNVKDNAWDKIGVTIIGFENYITTKFPQLFKQVYDVVKNHGPVDSSFDDY